MKTSTAITTANIHLLKRGDRIRFRAREHHRDDWKGPRDFEATVQRTVLTSRFGPRIITHEEINNDGEPYDDLYLEDDWIIDLIKDEPTGTRQLTDPMGNPVFLQSIQQAKEAWGDDVWEALRESNHIITFGETPGDPELLVRLGPLTSVAGRSQWMQTYSGQKFYPMDPRPEEIQILDIAHALSMQCRHNGHVERFMSVAEHCVLLSRLVSPENALWALLHGATEAYVGDMIRPLKLHMPEYRAVEDRVMAAIARRFNLEGTMPPEVKEADSRIRLDERVALLGHPADDWGIDLSPFGIEIPAWSPADAKAMYLRRFAELTESETIPRTCEAPETHLGGFRPPRLSEEPAIHRQRIQDADPDDHNEHLRPCGASAHDEQRGRHQSWQEKRRRVGKRVADRAPASPESVNPTRPGQQHAQEKEPQRQDRGNRGCRDRGHEIGRARRGEDQTSKADQSQNPSDDQRDVQLVGRLVHAQQHWRVHAGHDQECADDGDDGSTG